MYFLDIDGEFVSQEMIIKFLKGVEMVEEEDNPMLVCFLSFKQIPILLAALEAEKWKEADQMILLLRSPKGIPRLPNQKDFSQIHQNVVVAFKNSKIQPKWTENQP